MIKILIVEDELIIAEDLANSLRKMNYEVIGIAMDFEEAIEIITSNTPDLMLLDINLGSEKDGIQLAEELNKKYQIAIIFTTSYADSATLERAKKVNPINYLVKPFQQEQLFTAIEIAMYNLANKPERAATEIEEDSINEGLIIKDALFLKEKFRYTKLPIADILWIKAEGNYLEIHLAERKELIRASLSAFLEKINRKNFFRTHKSYAVNLDYLTKFEPTSVTILNTEIPISKNYSDELLKRLEII
jgi:DNA-binding LytR/AlgR family response regulator